MKKTKDFFDNIIDSINWKIGKFNMLPVFFGAIMAFIDIFMFSNLSMIQQGTLSSGLGIPLSISIYALQPLIFLKAMSYDGMAITNFVWNLLSSDVAVTLQGIVIFGESIKGLRLVGVLMSIVSICLMAYTAE
jgi:multidrug transporter EmrE-like cation transporter